MKKFHSRMMTLQNKFLILCICISIIPILSIGTYSYSVVEKVLQQNIHNTNITQFSNVDKVIFEKMKNIQRKVDILRYDKSIGDYIFNEPFDSKGFGENLERILSDADEVKGTILVLPSGEVFLYNLPFYTLDAIKFQLVYGRVNAQPGFITWMAMGDNNTHVGIKENYILAATAIHHKPNATDAAKIYFVFDKNLFNEVITVDPASERVYIFDSEINYLSGNEYKNLIEETSIKNVTQIFTNTSGIMEITEGGEKETITHYTSNLTNFKYVKIQKSTSFYKKINDIRITTITYLFVLSIVVLFIYMLIVKFITKPLVELSKVMKNFEENKLKTPIPIKNNDEIGIITKGYNQMLERIAKMLEDTKRNEQQKKIAEIKALTYQINPHFLYNTLAMIRTMAIVNNENEISNALLFLSRMFRRTLNNTDKYISISDEKAQLEDYIKLIEMRKHNKIKVEYKIHSSLENKSIPGMLLQPIVENAIVHGFSGAKNSDPKLLISAYEEDQHLMIEVCDNGVGIPKDKVDRIFLEDRDSEKGGIGLKNIAERIKLLFGEAYGISIDTQEGKYTNIIIKLPIGL